jgi:rRNA maturation protein Nop10
MADKVFDKSELDRLNMYQLQDERKSTERGIQKQIQMLHKFGPEDKFHEQRHRHLSLLYQKRSYIEKRLHQIKKEKFQK